MSALLHTVGKALQRAPRAPRRRLQTMPLAGLDQQCVKLIIYRGVGRHLLVDKLLEVLVGSAGGDHFVALEDTAGVGVHDKDRVRPAVKQNRVGRFLPDAVDSKQLLPQLFGGKAEHAIERAAVMAAQVG